jgi:uroporphyrinogen-III decarboxylase
MLAQGHIEAYRLYRHCPIVVGIDIYNLEAEAYGSPIDEPAGNGIPAISKHVYSSMKELVDLQPFDPRADGRIAMVIEAAKRIASECPETDVKIPLSGPFSLAANLIGFENLLCEVYTDPELVAEGLKHLVAGQVEFCRQVVRNGLDIAFFESAATPPLLSPDNFRDIELEALEKIMAETSAVVGHPVPCIMGGDTLPILRYIIQTGTGYVCCPAKTDQPKFMEAMEAYPEVMVRINMDPAGLSSKNFDVAQKEVDRVLALAENRQNVCIGTGCLPYEADPDVVLKAREYILSRSTG